MSFWFTADTHFGHGNIIRYCQRPFASVAEMDEALIRQWNARVRPGDTVYHLGDFSLGRPETARRYRARLQGRIVLLRGNHDRKELGVADGFEAVHELLHTKLQFPGLGAVPLTLCHYALRTWPKAAHGAWQLFGHSHGRLPDVPGASLDVGVDGHGFAPWSSGEIAALMAKRQAKPDPRA